jgi:hypothetical protein
MDLYSHSNNKILVAHFPDKLKEKYKDFINTNKEIIFSKPDNIDIISPITKDQISPLDYQLNKNNISYINPLRNKDINWNQPDKIKYVLEGLKISNNEYALILDGNDVIILNDLTNLIDIFNTYNKKIIYNADVFRYPNIIIEKERPFRFSKLNAGICFGKREDLIVFYEKALNFYNNSNKENKTEQFYIRNVAKDDENVDIDYECRFFQIFYVDFNRLKRK